jgi:hypothetical protein
MVSGPVSVYSGVSRGTGKSAMSTLSQLVRPYATRGRHKAPEAGKHRKGGPTETGALDPLKAAYEVVSASEGTYGEGEVTAACEMIAEYFLTVGEPPYARHRQRKST